MRHDNNHISGFPVVTGTFSHFAQEEGDKIGVNFFPKSAQHHIAAKKRRHDKRKKLFPLITSPFDRI